MKVVLTGWFLCILVFHSLFHWCSLVHCSSQLTWLIGSIPYHLPNSWFQVLSVSWRPFSLYSLIIRVEYCIDLDLHFLHHQLLRHTNFEHLVDGPPILKLFRNSQHVFSHTLNIVNHTHAKIWLLLQILQFHQILSALLKLVPGLLPLNYIPLYSYFIQYFLCFLFRCFTLLANVFLLHSPIVDQGRLLQNSECHNYKDL